MPTKGDGTFYSIPLSGTNFFERWFTLTVTKPADTTVERVSLTLKDAAGTTLQTLLTDEAEGVNVKTLEEGKKIKVRASMHSVSSSVPSTPPPAHYLRYEFVVKGTTDSQPVESDPKSPSEMNALWRMPQIFPRYSRRENGRDDWASRGAYAWLTAHSGIMKAINDISGEHALDLDHPASQPVIGGASTSTCFTSARSMPAKPARRTTTCCAATCLRRWEATPLRKRLSPAG